MEYLKITATPVSASIEVNAPPTTAYSILVAVTIEALEQIIPEMPRGLSPQRICQMFCECLDLGLSHRFGSRYGKSIAENPEKTPTADAKKPTAEEVLAMIRQLDDTGLRKLSNLIFRPEAADRQTKGAPKAGEKKDSAVGYAVFL